MRFNVISIFPEMLSAVRDAGVVGQAVKAQKISMEVVNPRTYTADFHRTVDDRPYGGGDGMVFLPEPLRLAMEDLSSRDNLGHVVYMSPQGTPWTDAKAREWAEGAKGRTVTLICGRYGGVDQRFLNEWVDEEISVGDFILSGGEIAAMAVIDSVSRLVPGVLGNSQSIDMETFSHGLLEAPIFTRPQEFLGQKVPDVLLSGDHKKIEKWRHTISILRTAKLRPDLIKDRRLVDAALVDARKIPPQDLKICGVDLNDLS